MLAFPANNYRENRRRMESTPKLGGYVFSSLVDKESHDKLSSARKIYLLYEDKKNRKKKKLIKSDFFLDGVGKSKWNKFG